MPKRRSSDEDGVSLFPFMSILACLIGILTLMISVMSQLKELDREKLSQEEYDRAITYRDLKIEIEQLRKLLAEIDIKIEKEKSSLSELQKLEDLRVVLKQKLDELQKAEDPKKSDAELQKIAENLRIEIKALKSERPALVKQLDQLKEELKKRKVPPKPVDSVVVRPGGVGSRAAQNLFFVECNATGIVLLEKGAEPVTVSKASITASEDYNKFLDKVKRTRDSMVLYLVRKAGNESYQWAAGWAETQFRLNTGKLPLPNDGKIDLSLFYK